MSDMAPNITDDLEPHRSGTEWDGFALDTAWLDESGVLDEELVVAAATMTVVSGLDNAAILVEWSIGDGITYDDNDAPDDDYPTVKTLRIHGPAGSLSLAPGTHTYYVSLTDDDGATFVALRGRWQILPAVPTS